ncbi:Methyl-accepting chemotaxis protein I (serine chemoreceptor protein) [Pseudomonas paraeruginosa]|nr:Methyl-accepting chemotaxis protein I (serine chemoreceptor protein) [Pseudomonas aeruginosa]
MESANPALAGDVERELASLREQAGRIDALPLLGVLDEQRSASDDFAAMMGLAGDAEAGAGNAEDRGVTLRRELASLLQRYPDELRRTRDLIERRQQLSADTGSRLDAVRQALATLEPQVRGERQRLQGQVRLIQGGMIVLILLIALAIDSLQRRLARVLGQLVPALSAWADGDFSRPIALRTRTEDLRNLEDSLNRLRSFLAELVGAIHRRAEQVAGSSQTLAEVSSGLHAGVERQAGDTGQIRDALGDMEAAIQQVAGDASQTADASRSAGQAVEHGQRVIGQSLGGLRELVDEVQGNAQSIERLAEESATIGSVLTVIRSIAEQTNSSLASMPPSRAPPRATRPRASRGRRGSPLAGPAHRRRHRGDPAAHRPPAAGRAAVGGGHAQPGRARRTHRRTGWRGGGRAGRSGRRDPHHRRDGRTHRRRLDPAEPGGRRDSLAQRTHPRPGRGKPAPDRPQPRTGRATAATGRRPAHHGAGLPPVSLRRRAARRRRNRFPANRSDSVQRNRGRT